MSTEPATVKSIVIFLVFMAGAYSVGYLDGTKTERLRQADKRIVTLERDKAATLALVGVVDKAKGVAVALCTAAGNEDCEQSIQPIER